MWIKQQKLGAKISKIKKTGSVKRVGEGGECEVKITKRFINSWVSRGFQVPRGYNTMADGGKTIIFKLDSNEILLYN